ncbi:MAG: hypothetical protein ACRDI2_20685 [Chloroflexota bacterium]
MKRRESDGHAADTVAAKARRGIIDERFAYPEILDASDAEICRLLDVSPEEVAPAVTPRRRRRRSARGDAVAPIEMSA